MRSCLHAEPGFAMPRLRRTCRQLRFRNLFSARPRTIFAAARAPKSGVRYGFDSSQARQTVR